MLARLTIALCVLGSGCAWAEGPSLMFTDSEVKDLELAISLHSKANPNAGLDDKAGDGASAEKAAPNIYVSAVLDLGEGRWTVWANGQRVSPGTQPLKFRVMAVKGNSVHITVPGTTEQSFSLHPHQTWLSQSQEIVEGIVP